MCSRRRWLEGRISQSPLASNLPHSAAAISSHRRREHIPTNHDVLLHSPQTFHTLLLLSQATDVGNTFPPTTMFCSTGGTYGCVVSFSEMSITFFTVSSSFIKSAPCSARRPFQPHDA